MIMSKLSDMAGRPGLRPGIKQAVDFLLRKDAGGLEDGKYPIDGDRVFAMVQRYATAEVNPPRFEAHRKYIDVQCIMSGAEVIGWAPLGSMAVTEKYDEASDVCFGFVPEAEWSPVALCAGELAVLYPEDAHAPKLPSGNPSRVTKIVVKVAVS